jgi:hypothetical protein
MIGDRVGMTVAADLSANVFAAFLLILIVLLARSGTPEPATRPAPSRPAAISTPARRDR